jgi:hypothetical protein
MCKRLSIAALMVSVLLVATLVPSTSQAFLGPIWTPFSCESLLGIGGAGCNGGGGSAGYGGAGYGTAGYYGSPYGSGDRQKHRGARKGNCR